MRIQISLVLTIGAAATLSACVEDTGSVGASGAPTAAEKACLRDVTGVTNNPDVMLIGSEFSEAGTFVRVGVGENRAPWQCIAYSDGTTASIQSLVDEGAA
ncbi:hypothetical protein QO034_14440 [Sedimentitalea sp. JM2-8]|uniref:Lipoprotein n=1 Tax=Sedimentitalea xiamensis TaxID=3050037 RepID=A0ABT7FGP0_9RHOB|nr:hypothetical protein [Sedimentitalea xiamensis]MDK3074306.1 hypothetical protein [Sedimentitalea xiamensis]